MSATLSQLRKMQQNGEKITCLTAYDATFAALFADAGVDMLMVGDSLGMVVQGQSSTLPVSVDHIIYHCQNVRRGCGDNMFVIADMPFMAYAEPEQALHNAARLMQEGKANMVKMEGGSYLSETFSLLSRQGIPICAHLGLQPQSVNKIGGFKLQGKDEAQAQRIIDDALALQDSGADMLVLECVPATLGQALTERLSMAVIGIGAGPACDGQVLVCYDMLGISRMHLPRFVKNFMPQKGNVRDAVEAFVRAVKSGEFPAPEHGY